MATKEQYGDLAEEILGFICGKYPGEPSPQEWAIILGAIEAVRYGIKKTLEERGHKIFEMEMGGQKQ